MAVYSLLVILTYYSILLALIIYGVSEIYINARLLGRVFATGLEELKMKAAMTTMHTNNINFI